MVKDEFSAQEVPEGTEQEAESGELVDFKGLKVPALFADSIKRNAEIMTGIPSSQLDLIDAFTVIQNSQSMPHSRMSEKLIKNLEQYRQMRLDGFQADDDYDDSDEEDPIFNLQTLQLYMDLYNLLGAIAETEKSEIAKNPIPTVTEINAAIEQIAKSAFQPFMNEEEIPEAVSAFRDLIIEAIGVFSDIASIPEFTEDQSRVREYVKFIRENADSFMKLTTPQQNPDEFLPFLLDEIESSEELEGKNLQELFADGFDPTGSPIDGTPIKIAVERAQYAHSEYIHDLQDKGLSKATYQTAIAKRIDHFPYPTDKPNNKLWTLIKTGNMKMRFDTSRDKETPAFIDYAINFDSLGDLPILKQLDAYDKRVYFATSALWNADTPGHVFTASQIHRAMGNTGSPSQNQIKRINESLTKMTMTRIHLDNTKEIAVNKGYKHQVYDGSLLPFERLTDYMINGEISESNIHLFREPPLMTFARERRQLITLDPKLLESPISKTETNLAIEDYLLQRIAMMRNTKYSKKILFSSVCQKCGITEKKARQRTSQKVTRYLDHYQTTGFIKGYTESPDSVTIIL